jgi:hypothetical protein
VSDDEISLLGVKIKAECQGFVANTQNMDCHAKRFPVTHRPVEAAGGVHDGESEPFLLVSEDFLGWNAEMPKELFDALVKVPEVSRKVNHAIGVCVSEMDCHESFEAIAGRCFDNGRHPFKYPPFFSSGMRASSCSMGL